MGGDFIEELAKMNYDHLKMTEHSLTDRIAKALAMKIGLDEPVKDQKSMPAYIYGVKLA